jgi:hypothetical protein
MKITNTPTSKPYHLDPDTQLEVERTNPFFNEAGEQTLPVTLPDSDHNRSILGYPDALANKRKPSQNIDATIQDGEYFTACRQAILGAKRNEGIETSFYMNEGAFFSRIPDTSLATVFADETIPGIATVQQGIAFCRTLLFTRHDTCAIFPVLTKGDDEKTTKWLNRVELMRPATGEYLSAPGNTGGFSYLGFLNEFEREEQIDDYTVSIPIGCYITPFIRANYVLRRMFTHFGYTLEETFFEKTYPFTDMVFINNTDDTLLNGDIRLTDMIPDILCSTLLNIYRKKFACEFIPDEQTKTVRIEFLSDILREAPQHDLSASVDGEITIQYPAQYKQLRISSKDTISAEGDSYDSLADVVAKYPDLFLETYSGNYCRRACSIDTTTGVVHQQNEVIASSDIPYYAGGTRETESVEVPDCAVIMKEPAYMITSGEGESEEKIIITGIYPGLVLAMASMYPYIGETRSLNSSILIHAGTDDDDDKETHTEPGSSGQAPMLAFVYPDTDMGTSISRGTVTNYDRTGKRRLSDYTLLYNGPDGIFERFYRPYDNLLRNSMHTVTAALLLSQQQKLSIPSCRKILLKGRELLINKLNFTIGGKNEPKESEFYTIQLYEPVSEAIPESERLPVYPAVNRFAQMQFYYKSLTESEYNASPYKVASIPVLYSRVFPPDTSANEGTLIWEKNFAVKRKTETNPYRLYTVTLRIPVKIEN